MLILHRNHRRRTEEYRRTTEAIIEEEPKNTEEYRRTTEGLAIAPLKVVKSL